MKLENTCEFRHCIKKDDVYEDLCTPLDLQSSSGGGGFLIPKLGLWLFHSFPSSSPLSNP